MKQRRTLLAAIGAIVVVAALAAIWSYVLLSSPPQQTVDQRVLDVASQLKCLVCQDESVADSPALLSQQMRALIRQQVQSGMSDQQIIQYFRARYGDRILWSPPRQGFTLLAWIVPPAALLLGLVLTVLVLRNWQRSASTRGGATVVGGAREEESDELAQFQAQLERELAAEDTIFLRLDKGVV